MLSSLLRISSHINTDKKAFFVLQLMIFSVWMFCYIQLNSLINKVRGRALKVVCQNLFENAVRQTARLVNSPKEFANFNY